MSKILDSFRPILPSTSIIVLRRLDPHAELLTRTLLPQIIHDEAAAQSQHPVAVVVERRLAEDLPEGRLDGVESDLRRGGQAEHKFGLGEQLEPVLDELAARAVDDRGVVLHDAEQDLMALRLVLLLQGHLP